MTTAVKEAKKTIENPSEVIPQQKSECMSVCVAAASDDQGFPEIDRKLENKLVLEYQKTQNDSILEKLYEQRVPTLQKWASDHSYLCDSSDDMFGEFRKVFMKTISKYRVNKRMENKGGKQVQTVTPFNTYLFTSFDHFVKNLKTKRKAKKRTPLNYEGTTGGFLLSLDHSYSSKDGSSATLAEIIPDTSDGDDGDVMKKLFLEDSVNTLAEICECPHVFKLFLKKLSTGIKLNTLIKEYKSRYGKLYCDEATIKALKELQEKEDDKSFCQFIDNNTTYDSAFSLVEYRINDDNLEYIIELNRCEETDAIMKSVRKIRKNKRRYREKLDIV